jgi:hypothetical protein
MGKKKKAKHAADGGRHNGTGSGFQMPPALAGIAATVARQVATPAGRQMIAGALVAAAGAIAGRVGARGASAEAPVPPVPPVPPTAPEPSETRAGYAPKFEASSLNLPPEAARVVGAAASALERWAQGLARPPKPPEG